MKELLTHFPDVHNSQGCPSTNQEPGTSSSLSMWVLGAQSLVPSSDVLPGYYQGIGSEIGQLGHELHPKWKATLASDSFVHYTTILALKYFKLFFYLVSTK